MHGAVVSGVQDPALSRAEPHTAARSPVAAPTLGLCCQHGARPLCAAQRSAARHWGRTRAGARGGIAAERGSAGGQDGGGAAGRPGDEANASSAGAPVGHGRREGRPVWEPRRGIRSRRCGGGARTEDGHRPGQARSLQGTAGIPQLEGRRSGSPHAATPWVEEEKRWRGGYQRSLRAVNPVCL